MFEAGFIGCGNMGGTLAAAAAKSGASVLAADRAAEKTERLAREYGAVPADAKRVAAESGMIFLGVKPQGLRETADEIRPVLAERKDRFVVVSMAAGVTAATVRALTGGAPVIRIMPNLPASVGKGVILYCADGVTEREEAVFAALMRSAGTIEKIPEEKIDAASAVTGCGPAFVCMFAEALTDGAVRCGLTRAQAREFALRTVAGTAEYLLESGKDPAVLRAEVCSPAGSTIEGVAALEEGALRAVVMDAVDASYRRTKELQNI
mgnify:CR=1 FL=1